MLGNDGNMRDAAQWLDALPAELSRQRRLLERLLTWCEQDADTRWLVVGCSLARGNADALSDLDVGIGVTDGQVDAVARRFVGSAGQLGPLVECFEHQVAEVRFSHRRVFAQFADRAQIDLFIADASHGSAPGAVTLYDPEGMVTKAQRPAPDDADAAYTWACRAWEALADVGKYLRRESSWEAHDRLEGARERFWQLWASAQKVPEPQFGITSLLDAGADLPVDIEATVATLELQQILAAARRLVQLLSDLQGRLSTTGPYRFPQRLGAFVTDDLNSLGSKNPSP